MQQSPDQIKFDRDLIHHVRSYPCLYNRQDPSFRDAKVKNPAWREIASKFGEGTSVTKCRKTFALLLNKFLKLHDEVLAENITTEMAVKQFRLYNDMMYAKLYAQFSEDGFQGSGTGSGSSSQQSSANRCNQSNNTIGNRHSGPAPPSYPNSLPFNHSPASGSGMGYSQASHSRNNYSDRFSSGSSGSHGNWSQNSPPKMPNFSLGPPPRQPQFNSNRSSQFVDHPQNHMARSNDKRTSRDLEDDRDDSHIDFFFRGISQQVKRAKVNGEEFLDLQATILDILVHQLPNYNKK